MAGLRLVCGVMIQGITDLARFDRRRPTVAFTLEGYSPRQVAERPDKRASLCGTCVTTRWPPKSAKQIAYPRPAIFICNNLTRTYLLVSV